MAGNMKKRLIMVTAAVVSGVVLTTSALAASLNVSGYEKLKTAAFNGFEMENFTLNTDIAVEFDGETILNGNVLYKAQDYNNSSAAALIDRRGEKEATEEYLMNGTRVNNYGSGYRSYPASYRSQTFMLTDNQKKLLNILTDLFAGDTKNYFNNQDGNITVRLERNQIPEVVQTGITVMAEIASKELEESNYDIRDGDFEHQLIQLLYGMSIDYVYVNADVDDNDVITRMEFTTGISGRESGGTPHSMTINLNAAFSDVGTTVADTIDMGTYPEIIPREDIQVEITGDGSNAVVVFSNETSIETQP